MMDDTDNENSFAIYLIEYTVSAVNQTAHVADYLSRLRTCKWMLLRKGKGVFETEHIGIGNLVTELLHTILINRFEVSFNGV
jgi:hypothetical protein